MPNMQIYVHFSKSEKWEIIHVFIFHKYDNKVPR